MSIVKLVPESGHVHSDFLFPTKMTLTKLVNVLVKFAQFRFARTCHSHQPKTAAFPRVLTETDMAKTGPGVLPALWTAATQGQMEDVKQLLADGEDVKETGLDNTSCLHVAVWWLGHEGKENPLLPVLSTFHFIFPVYSFGASLPDCVRLGAFLFLWTQEGRASQAAS